MLRADFIHQVSSGIFSYLPLAWRSLRKIEQIIREEMDAAGGQELRMSVLQPRELWQESGRDEDYGDGMFRLRDRREREIGARAHTRGAANDNGEGQRQQLPRPAAHPLPDTNEVPRRAAAQGRPAARPRIRHEGRVQLRHRAGRARCQLRLDGEGVQEHLQRDAAWTPSW